MNVWMNEKGIQIGKEEAKLLSFTDMINYVENLIKSTKKKLLEFTILEKSQDTRSVESILLSFYILARSNQKFK